MVLAAVRRARPSLVVGTGGSPTMELTAPHREPSRALAWRALTSLGAAPLARPIGAKSPWNTFFEVGVCHAQISTSYGVLLYPI